MNYFLHNCVCYISACIPIFTAKILQSQEALPNCYKIGPISDNGSGKPKEIE